MALKDLEDLASGIEEVIRLEFIIQHLENPTLQNYWLEVNRIELIGKVHPLW